MFFVYFSGVIILGIVVFKDSKKYNVSRWWAGLVGLAPVTMPYYLFVTRGKKLLPSLVIFSALFVLVVIFEVFFYTNLKQKIQRENYSPYVKQALEYTTELRKTTAELNRYIESLDELGRVNSSLEKIIETLKMVEKMGNVLIKTTAISQDFLILMKDYSSTINQRELQWLHPLAVYYADSSVIKYINALQFYIDAFSGLLKFTRDNFNEIHLKNSKQQKNYDYYYLKYISSLERHNHMDVKRMIFQKKFLQKYPDLVSHIPVISHTRFLRVWK